MINGIAHTALYTDRFEETVSFYKQAFDAVELGYFRTSRRGTWLKLGESIIEIFEVEERLPEGAFRHIALSCDSVDDSYAKAIECGAAPYSEPHDITLDLDEKKSIRIAFVKGVSGEQIELCKENEE